MRNSSKLITIPTYIANGKKARTLIDIIDGKMWAQSALEEKIEV